MRDMIYREDAIGACAYETIECYEARKAIRALPSADRSQGEWIPCSERLPSEQGQYLITFPLCNGDLCVYVLSFCKGKFYDGEWGDIEYDDVTAWMPLPKPYGERKGNGKKK